jgi:hypothetical protein
MIMEKRYDRAALIQAYIATKEPYGHEDIKRFNAERLNALEQAFGLSLASDGVRKTENNALWMLFRATVDSYLSIRTPGSNFMDGSLIMHQLEKLAERAQPLMDNWAAINAAAEASREAHLHMLDELFKLLWGEIDTVVTSERLRPLGFDDSQEPNWLDYE